MDNASYHSRRKEEYPVKSWNCHKMVEWLVYYNVPFEKQGTKDMLYNTI